VIVALTTEVDLSIVIIYLAK